MRPWGLGLAVTLAVSACVAETPSSTPTRASGAPELSTTSAPTRAPSATSVSATPPPIPLPTSPPASVVITGLYGPAMQAATYTVALVAADGHTLATATPHSRSRLGAYLPLTSTSSTRVYYLDGDSDIRWLAPDGSTGLAMTVGVGPAGRIGFAVSPDDRRIAIGTVESPGL